MDELRIHTQIRSRYQIFDASGQLPFSIVFGLCRRSLADADPRPLLLDIAGSVLDVPYALAHGLLTLHEQGPPNAEQGDKVTLGRLSNVAATKAEYLSLPSPVNRTAHWRDAFTVYRYDVAHDGDLASILEPGKKYTIRLAGKDLGVERWAYGHEQQIVDKYGKPNQDSEAVKLVNSKLTAGSAKFTVVESLSWPPRIKTGMRLCASSLSSDSARVNFKSSNNAALEVFVIKIGSEPVTVQTRGHQRVLIPWGPFQPEPDANDDRMRIIDTMPHKPPTSSLQVIDSVTSEVIRGNKQSGICSLMDSTADRRPKAMDLVTLMPGAPFVRTIDIGGLVDGLMDGQYRIQMQSKGCRWWCGEVGKEEGEDGRVSAHLCRTLIPPVMLESQDEVEIRIKDGKLVFSSVQPLDRET